MSEKTVLDLKYRQPIIDRLDRQTQKGINKYGQVLDENDLSLEERFEYMAEELTDALVYLEHLKLKLIPKEETYEEISVQILEKNERLKENHQKIDAIYEQIDELKAQIASIEIINRKLFDEGMELSKKYELTNN